MSPNATLGAVAVIDPGYIGLPTTASLVQAGRRIIGADVKQSMVDAINAGTVPLVEEGLETVVAVVVAQEQLSVQTETPEADAYIVSVPMPFKDEHDAALSYIEGTAKTIAPKLNEGELVALESSAPLGPTEHIAETMLRARSGLAQEPNHPNALYFAHAAEHVLHDRVMIEIVESHHITDDLPKSQSKDIAVSPSERLHVGTVLDVRPNIDALPGAFEGHRSVKLAELDEALERAHNVLLLVDHEPFATIDRERLQEKIVIDTKGTWH